MNFSVVNGDQLLSLIVETNVTVDNLIGNIGFWIKKNPESSSYEIQGLKSSINLCRLSEGIAGHFLMRSLVEAIKETENRMFTCPFVPQIYHVKNVPVHDKFLPKFLLMGSIHFKVNASVKGKFGNSKKFEYAFSYVGLGKIDKD